MLDRPFLVDSQMYKVLSQGAFWTDTGPGEDSRLTGSADLQAVGSSSGLARRVLGSMIDVSEKFSSMRRSRKS